MSEGDRQNLHVVMQALWVLLVVFCGLSVIAGACVRVFLWAAGL
jgi:hypothetical protein